MAAVASSWISDASWSNGTLTLTMNGRSYDYADPDGALYQGIVTAPSAGAFYNERIKGTVAAPGGAPLVSRAVGIGRVLLTRGRA